MCATAKRRNDYIFAPKKERRGVGCSLTLLLILVAVIVSVIFYNTAMNKKLNVNTEKVTVMSLDKAYEGFTVLHISDLHASSMGSDLTLWREKLFGKKYSAVVMTGDMVGKSGEYEPLLSLIHTLKEINAEAPIYFISGDDDPVAVNSAPRGTPEVLADWVLAAQKAGATYLDAPIKQQAGKKAVWFIPEYLYDIDAEGMFGTLTNQKADMEARGQQYESEGGAAYRALCYRLDATERTITALKDISPQDLQIAVAHAPMETDYIRSSIEWADQNKPINYKRISLLMAGHYCGGQWRLPWGGAIYVPDLGWFPQDNQIIGMRRINSINQYVSGGVGASDLYPVDVRLFNPPSVTLISFTARLQQS